MSKIGYIIDFIASRNPIHTKKLKKNLSGLGEVYDRRAEKFLTRYEAMLAAEGKTLDYAIDSYLRMLADFTIETMRFRETGQYSSKSFAEVEARVYSQPGVMEYYMHGLLLSQFLWKHHYEMLCFFSAELTKRKVGIKNYLEIGGGHGLQVTEAINIIGTDATYTVVDISSTSLELARRLVANPTVKYVLCDVFKFQPPQKFDFITIGEVLEHLEDPQAMLRHVANLLTDDGTLFITTPTNAPAIDHIYLFNNADEIRQLINAAGYNIVSEFTRYAEDVTPEFAEKHKVASHYGAILKIKK